MERSPKFADRLDGFAVSVGAEWALLAQTSDGGFFNGYVAFRLRDVSRIDRDTTFETAFSRTRPEWPPAVPGPIDLDSTVGVLAGLARISPLVAIQKDKERSAIWIGLLTGLSKRAVDLREVRPDATWHSFPRRHRLGAITTVEVSTHYLRGLTAIAGVDPDA
ncbi:hypothetical protein [Microbacterium maritypicum]